MLKVKKTVTETVDREVTLYVASDGREFESAAECCEYETGGLNLSWSDVLTHTLLRVADFDVCYELEDEPLFYSQEYINHPDKDYYVWIRPLTRNDCDKIQGILNVALDLGMKDDFHFLPEKWFRIHGVVDNGWGGRKVSSLNLSMSCMKCLKTKLPFFLTKAA